MASCCFANALIPWRNPLCLPLFSERAGSSSHASGIPVPIVNEIRPATAVCRDEGRARIQKRDALFLREREKSLTRQVHVETVGDMLLRINHSGEFLAIDLSLQRDSGDKEWDAFGTRRFMDSFEIDHRAIPEIC